MYNGRIHVADRLSMTIRKLWIIISLGIAILAVLVLSSSLAGLEMPLGEPFSLGTGTSVRPPPAAFGAEPSPLAMFIVRAMLLFILALLPFSVLYLLFTPDGRRKLLQNLVIFGVLLGLIYMLRRQFRTEGETDVLSQLSMAPADEIGEMAKPAEFSGAVPDWLVFVASFALAALIATLVIVLVWALVRRRRQAKPGIALEQLAQQAEEAADAIEAGGDLRDTVIRCYLEMNRVVREARGILRQQAMTPREFEEQLERAGLPREQVRDLTRLFEDVRYGSKALGEWEGRRAIACLSTIADACRSLT